MEKYKSAINIGLFWGFGYIILSMIFYLINHNLLHSMWIQSILFLVGLGIMYYAGTVIRKDFGGLIKWKDAMTGIWLSSLIFIVITNLFTYVLYQWIDPDLKAELMQVQVKAVDNMRDFLGEEEYEKALEALQQTDSFDMSGILKSIPFFALGYFAISCLIALAVKKEQNWDAGNETFNDKF
ncbi:MAG: DUF4199 domain-containing protein [Saprospiraceae bacterium]|nr:DUF4199 domain-containing protein [Saprospiraceae bacterium]